MQRRSRPRALAGLNLSAPEAVVACTSSSLGDLGLYECLLIAYALIACMDGDESRARGSDSDDHVASSARACERGVHRLRCFSALGGLWRLPSFRRCTVSVLALVPVIRASL